MTDMIHFMSSIFLFTAGLVCGFSFSSQSARKKRKPEKIKIALSDNIIFQYIADAHQLVLGMVGVDPLREPVAFQQELDRKICDITSGIETLREAYADAIREDPEYGKKLEDYDLWKKQKNVWKNKKISQIRIIRSK